MIEVLDSIGVFVFAWSGAVLAIQHRLDIVGAITLAVVTGVAGGIVRDVLLGATPPGAFANQTQLAIPLLAAMAAIGFPRLIGRLHRPVLVLDAIGLALFAVVGATRALDAGLGVGAASVIGAISATGGGVVRDVFVGRTPIVFTPDSGLYVIPACLGALVVALAVRVDAVGDDLLATITVTAAGLTVLLRLASLRFRWQTPRLTPAKAPEGPDEVQSFETAERIQNES